MEADMYAKNRQSKQILNELHWVNVQIVMRLSSFTPQKTYEAVKWDCDDGKKAEIETVNNNFRSQMTERESQSIIIFNCLIKS